jgi:hypothetical protein
MFVARLMFSGRGASPRKFAVRYWSTAANSSSLARAPRLIMSPMTSSQPSFVSRTDAARSAW